MVLGIREDVVQLVPIRVLAHGRMPAPVLPAATKGVLFEGNCADCFAIHVCEGKNPAVADMCPSQGAGIAVMGCQPRDVAAALEINDGKFYRNLSSVGTG